MNKEKCDLFGNFPETILQVLPSLETGGVENGTIEVALALKNKGFKPLVASNGGKLVKALDQQEIKHITLPLHSKNPIQMILNVFRLLWVIKEYQVSLLHARSRAPAWSAKLACILGKIPLVTTFHGTYNFHNKIKRGYNAIMVKGDRVIAVSEFIKAHILHHYSHQTQVEKVVVIHRGIDLNKYASLNVTPDRVELIKHRWQLKADIPLILMPARLTAWKGQMVLIKALSILKSKGIRFQCVLAGSAQGRVDYRRSLDQLIHAVGLDSDIQFDESCPDLAAGYTQAALVVHASTDPEAFGRVIVEAQAMGVPVIASNIGAPCEIIENEKTGWLHKAGDSEDLAHKIETVLKLTAPQKTALIKRALEKVQREYSNQLMFQRTIAVYEELLYS